MKDKFIKIPFDKHTATPVRDVLANSYGFDLTDENLIGYTIGKLKFTIMGFRATNRYDMLIATIKVALIPHVNDEYTYIQKLDLFHVDRLNTYSRSATAQLKLNTEHEMKSALYTLREKLDKYRHDELKNTDRSLLKPTVPIHEQKEAMVFLTTDNILDSIEGLLVQAGIVTEKEKALLLFFILLSRHFDKPLHALFQGSPQLSKMLMEVVGSCIPDEQIHSYTSMSTSTLYYTKHKNNWKNNVLYLTNIDRHFKGAATVKEFIENGILKHSTTESNYHTGRIYASKKVVEGTICLLTYSNDEMMNKKFSEECFFIRVNETGTNKADMLEYVKMQYGGMIDIHQQQDAIRKLKNIQRLIQPVKVVIPYAMGIRLPTTVNQQLRSLPQLLTFIKSVTLLHQHLLPKKTDNYGHEYVEATPEHLKIALELFRSIIITQGDVLNQNQRNLLERLKIYIGDQERFRIPDAMRLVGMYGTGFYKEFNILKTVGFVTQCGGNRKTGIEYQLTDWEDYQELENEINNWSKQQIETPGLPEVSKKQKEIKTIIK